VGGTISSGAITSSDISNFQRDLRSAGQIRATGWYGDTASTDYTGMALEIGVSGSIPHILAYNRNTSSYGQLRIYAAGITLYGLNNDITFDDTLNIADSSSTSRLEIGGTTIVDSSRNLTNIATVNATQFKWNTDVSGTNYLGSDIYDGLVLHSRPDESIFYGSGETSSSVKAHIFYSSTTSNSALGNEVFSITAGGDSTFAGNINTTGSYQISGVNRIVGTSSYTEFRNPQGVTKLWLGGGSDGTADPSAYINGNNFWIRDFSSVTNAVFSSSGLDIKRGDIKINGTTVIDSSRNLTNIGTISSGDIDIGTADTTNGILTIHGGATGNAEGGEIRLGLSADHDGTYVS
jgi:hypothetical protein